MKKQKKRKVKDWMFMNKLDRKQYNKKLRRNKKTGSLNSRNAPGNTFSDV